MTTLKETIGKLNKLYLELYDSNDGFACSMIINDIEIAIKSYATKCSQASLEKASENATLKYLEMFGGNFLGSPKVVDKESITNPENIILL